MVLSDNLISWLLVLTMNPDSINLHQDCEPKVKQLNKVSEMLAFIN